MARVTTCMSNIRVLLNNMASTTAIPATFAAFEGHRTYVLLDGARPVEEQPKESHPERFAVIETQSAAQAVKPDFNFPMPGCVGPNLSTDGSRVELLRGLAKSEQAADDDDMTQEEFEKALSSLNKEGVSVQPIGNPAPFGEDLLECECSAQTVNRRVQRSLMEMFPGAPALPRDGLTVVTVSQRTHDSMANWSDKVADEREEALDKFMVIAKSACGRLTAAGYWADFVDPSSGRAYYASHTPHTLMETDERMRHLGYSVEDLGCCKCLAHPEWGTHVFGGVLVTNAPIGSPALEAIIGSHN